MKAYLFIETGEFRCPKSGEYTINNNIGEIERAISDFEFIKATILARHEIEIPEWATRVHVDCVRADDVIHALHEFPVPRPKKKVKKWRWLACASGGSPFISGSHYTESRWEKEYAPIHEWSRKIPESEIEVEE